MHPSKKEYIIIDPYLDEPFSCVDGKRIPPVSRNYFIVELFSIHLVHSAGRYLFYGLSNLFCFQHVDMVNMFWKLRRGSFLTGYLQVHDGWRAATSWEQWKWFAPIIFFTTLRNPCLSFSLHSFSPPDWYRRVIVLPRDGSESDTLNDRTLLL